jgi:predicted DNA-binding ArsR family transcriptional regulator
MEPIDRILAAIEELTASDRRLEERLDLIMRRLEENEARVTQLMDTMNRLPNIVMSHEERLEDLEAG